MQDLDTLSGLRIHKHLRISCVWSNVFSFLMSRFPHHLNEKPHSGSDGTSSRQVVAVPLCLNTNSDPGQISTMLQSSFLWPTCLEVGGRRSLYYESSLVWHSSISVNHRKESTIIFPSWREIVWCLQLKEPHDLDWGFQLHLLTLLQWVFFIFLAKKMKQNKSLFM